MCPGMARLLVIEDQQKLRRNLQQLLAKEGYDVVTSGTGEDGFYLAMTESFDCVVLDLTLPGRDGLQVLGDLRKGGSSVPVLILTARDSVDDRVDGLDSGADDYLVKPFAHAELLARIRALLRRGCIGTEQTLRCDDVELDTARGELRDVESRLNLASASTSFWSICCVTRTQMSLAKCSRVTSGRNLAAY